MLLVDIPAAGAEPKVEVRAVGRHPWIELEESLAVASDLERTIARLQALPELAVVDLSLAGELHLLGRQQLEAAL